MEIGLAAAGVQADRWGRGCGQRPGRGGGGSQTIRLTVSKCNRFAPRRVWEGSGQWIIGSAPDRVVVPPANKDFVAFMIFFNTCHATAPTGQKEAVIHLWQMTVC